MSETSLNIESLLEQAFTPVEPPVDMADRLESTLVSISKGAAEDLSEWELASIDDPRTWVKPAVAVVAGSVAVAALYALRTKNRQAQGDDFLKELKRVSRSTAERSLSAAEKAAKELRESADHARSRLNL